MGFLLCAFHYLLARIMDYDHIEDVLGMVTIDHANS